MSGQRPIAVVTGASSGIGAAAARKLVASGWDVVLGARRIDRLTALAEELGSAATAYPLDVADTASVQDFSQQVASCRLLVNNAGGALGLERVDAFDEEHWRTMYETNVLGVARMTRALLPKLLASGDGHVITIGSVASFEPYAGGGGYNAAKAGTTAICDVLRLELNGQPIRISEIDPGLVETEFSLVRFDGDNAKADAVYNGITPLTADDVAETVVWIANRPSHVDIDRVVMRPRAQARVWLVHRDTTPAD
jgi:NADP-dependent 3-hydroxy acid dehydrogenase YdfG